MTTLLRNAVLHDGHNVIEDAFVAFDDGGIVAIGVSGDPEPIAAETVDLNGRRLLPGFVDIQVNGGGGVLFNDDPSVETVRRIADAHVQFGTTSFLPTLISDDDDVIQAGIEAVRDAIAQGVHGVMGIHIEGPYLNAERKGAHDASRFRALDDDGIKLLTSLGSPGVTLVTLAPEIVDGEYIQQLVDAGVIVFAGHTAATYDECKAAEAAGVSGYTHLFNAMSQFGSREPGVVGAAIGSSSACFGIIADGVHVHPLSFRIAVQAKHRGGAFLVTDAMPTVGSSEPYFRLGGEQIEVRDGVLRNANGSLAGSHLSMDRAIANATAFARLDWAEAVRMATSYPGSALQLDKCAGTIAPGLAANLVETDENFEVNRVWRRGTLVTGHPS